jgi:hypothetical protein
LHKDAQPEGFSFEAHEDLRNKEAADALLRGRRRISLEELIGGDW